MAVSVWLVDAAADAGADLRFGREVTRLERSGGRVTAVVAGEERIPCDAVVLTPDLRVRVVNPVFYEQFQVSPEETTGCLIYDLGNREWDTPELHTLLEEILPENGSFDGYEVAHEFKDLGRRVMLLNARRLDHRAFFGVERFQRVIAALHENVGPHRVDERPVRQPRIRRHEHDVSARLHGVADANASGRTTANT